VEDYNLLAELNTLAASRYASMTERTAAYLKFIQRVQTIRTLSLVFSYAFRQCLLETYRIIFVVITTETELQPHLNQVDVLHQKTTELQQLVTHLDAYTIKLEASFKKMFP
jgi:hypothetical protein